MIFKTTIGQAAEGDAYFRRPNLDKRFWRYINNGSHLLISAPRRVGKTSFLKNICNQPIEGYNVKYHVTESINSSNEFFKRLYKSVLEELSASRNIWEELKETIKRNKIGKVGKDGIELKATDLNYFDEFKRLIMEITFENKLVFVIDEFSETTENIINDFGESDGKQFLHQNRELRQGKQISYKLQFVYSGSIGLGNIAEKIGAIKSINDLANLEIPPFSEKEAFELITQISVDPNLNFTRENQQHLLKKIHWLMPFYIQLILDELETLLLENNTAVRKVDKKLIEKALEQALNKRNYFEHWHTRLRTAYNGSEYTFAKELLNMASKASKGINTTQIYDLAVKHGVEENYNIIQRTLEYDGYISPDKNKNYMFNSSLLKIWWNRNIAI